MRNIFRKKNFKNKRQTLNFKQKKLYLHPNSDQPLAKIVNVALNQLFKNKNHV